MTTKPKTIGFKLNGKYRTFSGNSETKLLNYLREVEGIITPKNGCAPQGTCGCCTVEVDGKATHSCVTPMKRVDGKSIITIQGMEDRVQDTFAKAFMVKGGIQCGYCTPGIIQRAKVLLQKNPNPSEEEVVKALSSHLCRCTGYKKIIDSILYAAEALRDGREIALPKTMGKVGERHPKYQAYQTALGLRPFVNDLSFPDMLYGTVKLSDHPRAKIIKIDTAQAERMPGVVRIFKAHDIPGDKKTGLILHDWPLFRHEGEVTAYVGDALAFVVAESDELAREAAQKIEVEYQVLAAISDPEKALMDSSPKVHLDHKNNLLDNCHFKRGGSAEKALAESAFVAKGRYTTQRIEHAYLEPESCVALPNTDGGIKVFDQGQGVYENEKQLGILLGVPREKIDVVLVPNGGAFGGKEDLTVQGHCALAAYLLQRSVKCTLSREESLRVSIKKHPMILDYQVGCDAQGKLTAVRARIVGDSGAYASVGMKVLERAAGHCASAYYTPVLDVEALSVYTNNAPCGAMRGFGANQAIFAMESCIEDLCHQGNFDPWEFRYQNALTEGLLTATGQKLQGGVGARATLEAIKPYYDQAKVKGLAMGMKNTGIGNGFPDASKVKISIESPEKIILYHGWTEMGQGVFTMALQSFCEETGLDPNLVEVRVESAVKDAEAGMTTASRGTSLVGLAMISACKKLKEDLEIHSLEELVGKNYYGEWKCQFTTVPGEVPLDQVVTHYSYGYATQLVILDSESGKIDQVVAAHDAGKIMNPTLFEGQIEGAVHMGLGYALTENFPYDEHSRPISLKLKDCHVLRARETPPIKVVGIEITDPIGPYGAKGIGEIGLVPTAPAARNAFFHFDGVKRTSLPLLKLQKKKVDG